MCDLFLVLAQAPGGLSCFLVPRVLPDGTRNPFRIARLKDKLGNRSNASSEPEFDGTLGWLVGAEGRGVKTIIEMVNGTRLDCVAGSAGLMRKALVEALHHTRHRSAFGARLADQPLMRAVLADLAVESEAATALALRLAGAADRAIRGDEGEQAFRRVATAVGKYWVTKRAPAFAAEALECLGGNGYVEESGMPRLYREAPLNSVWEGSGNVNALDVLRALRREPGTAQALLDELALASAPTPAWTRRCCGCTPSSPTPTPSRPAPAGSSSAWRWPCRARCWCATPRRRADVRSAPPASPATGDCGPFGHLPGTPTRQRSSTVPRRSHRRRLASPTPPADSSTTAGDRGRRRGAESVRAVRACAEGHRERAPGGFPSAVPARSAPAHPDSPRRVVERVANGSRAPAAPPQQRHTPAAAAPVECGRGAALSTAGYAARPEPPGQRDRHTQRAGDPPIITHGEPEGTPKSTPRRHAQRGR
jgi:hypothetical protein